MPTVYIHARRHGQDEDDQLLISEIERARALGERYYKDRHPDFFLVSSTDRSVQTCNAIAGSASTPCVHSGYIRGAEKMYEHQQVIDALFLRLAHKPDGHFILAVMHMPFINALCELCGQGARSVKHLEGISFVMHIDVDELNVEFEFVEFLLA